MSTDFSIRPVGTPAATPVVQSTSSEAANNAVPTELPASQSVTVVDAGVVVRKAALSQRIRDRDASHAGTGPVKDLGRSVFTENLRFDVRGSYL